MKRLILALALLLAPLTAHAADAIVLMDAAGQTLYVRVYTSSSAAVAAALTAGTSGNTRRYAVTDAALVSASMTATPGNYAYDVFAGTPSTSAADYAIASGILRWGGTVAVDPLPLVTTGSSGGLLIAGSNAATTFSTLTSTGEFTANGTTMGASLAAAAADAAELNDTKLTTARAGVLTDWIDGGRLDLILDAKATSAEVTATTDDRDLEPVQHEWRLKRSGSSGVLRSTNPLYLHPGDGLTAGIRAGWDCTIPAILPDGSVLSTMTTPTSSDDTAGVNVVAKLGIDGKVAKVQLSADADAAVGSYWITTQVTNNVGGGPITIYGEVVIQAAP